MKRLLLALPVAALILAFYALGLHRYLTLDAFHAGGETFDAWYAAYPISTVVGYVAIFALTTLFLPVAALMTLVAGALFGFWKGLVVASFAGALAATLGFWLSRYILHDTVQRQLGERLAAVNAGIAKDGAFYLFSLRLVPVVPFFAINLVMGLTPMRTRTFYWVTQLGMLAGTLVYVTAGTQLAEVDDIADALSPGLLGSLALLGVFPIVAKKLLGLLRRWLAERRDRAAR
jgi:uncharacterized membrane protein YdjX (TVP38/TMEM64 family)